MATSLMSRRISATLAIVFLLPSLIFFIMWSSIGLRMSGISESEKMHTYIGYFHGWLHSISTIHIISLSCCVVAIILALRSFSKELLSVRVLMIATAVIALFILIFDVYQLI